LLARIPRVTGAEWVRAFAFRSTHSAIVDVVFDVHAFALAALQVARARRDAFGAPTPTLTAAAPLPTLAALPTGASIPRRAAEPAVPTAAVPAMPAFTALATRAARARLPSRSRLHDLIARAPRHRGGEQHRSHQAEQKFVVHGRLRRFELARGHGTRAVRIVPER
jgi:hypothetical protein